jgi:hypothetical protein
MLARTSVTIDQHWSAQEGHSITGGACLAYDHKSSFAKRKNFANHFYIFFLVTCKSTKNVDLNWNDFAKYFDLICFYYSTTRTCNSNFFRFITIFGFLNHL